MTGIAVVVAALGLLAGEAERAVGTTDTLRSPPTVAAARAGDAQSSCLAGELRRLVPKGALIYVGPSGVDQQRLAESAGLWAMPVWDMAGASWRLSLRPTRGGCDGLRVAASRT